jgi:hypothetical protein
MQFTPDFARTWTLDVKIEIAIKQLATIYLQTLYHILTYYPAIKTLSMTLQITKGERRCSWMSILGASMIRILTGIAETGAAMRLREKARPSRLTFSSLALHFLSFRGILKRALLNKIMRAWRSPK